MTTYFKYRVKCTTDNKYEYWIFESTESPPTKCPTNTAHTIDDSLTIIVDNIEDSVVTIKEETTKTGGHFKLDMFKMVCPPDSTTSKIFSFPYPISVISANLITDEDHRGDIMSWIVNPNTTIGALTASYTAKPVWTSQNYSVNDYVWYTADDENFGRNYRCKVNTVSNEPPSNTTYWEKLTTTYNVSGTVISYLKLGFRVTLTNGVNSEDIGYVSNINVTDGTITTNGATQYNFSAGSPTYVQLSVMFMDNVEFGPGMQYSVGSAKLGSSYVPANTIVKSVYKKIGRAHV